MAYNYKITIVSSSSHTYLPCFVMWCVNIEGKNGQPFKNVITLWYSQNNFIQILKVFPATTVYTE